MSIELVMPSNHLILCCSLLFLPAIFPSIRVFSNESVLHIRWPKYWSFSFRISPSNEYSGMISFRMDWLDFLAVQGTLKSLQYHLWGNRLKRLIVFVGGKLWKYSDWNFAPRAGTFIIHWLWVWLSPQFPHLQSDNDTSSTTAQGSWADKFYRKT